MAEHYTQFSEQFVLPEHGKAPQEIQSFLSGKLKEVKDGSDWMEDDDDWAFNWEIEGRGLWVYSDEAGDLDMLSTFLESIQTYLEIKDTPWVVGFSQSCSKPRPGEFGGGAILVLNGESHWFDPIQLANESVSGILSRK